MRTRTKKSRPPSVRHMPIWFTRSSTDIGTKWRFRIRSWCWVWRHRRRVDDSIPMYAELKGSQFLENLEYWHLSTGWKSYYSKAKGYLVNSVSLYDVILCAHGVEQNGKLTCKSKLFGSEMLRLLPCRLPVSTFRKRETGAESGTACIGTACL